MTLLDDPTLGRYHPGDSALHRLDPRLKLGGFPLLAIAAFSSASPSRLSILTGLAAILWIGGQIPLRSWWRGIRALRWLLLFSVLLHLFFSPGRTLWGVAWLSRDGLEAGLTVDLQLILAVTFSSLLTLTTAPREIAAALGAFLSPLGRFGVPVRETVLLFLLVLHFIPILREEGVALLDARRVAGDDPGKGPLSDRFASAGRFAALLLHRLIDRADALALAAARGEELPGAGNLPELRPRPADHFILAAGLLGMVLIFGYLQ